MAPATCAAPDAGAASAVRARMLQTDVRTHQATRPRICSPVSLTPARLRRANGSQDARPYRAN